MGVIGNWVGFLGYESWCGGGGGWGLGEERVMGLDGEDT